MEPADVKPKARLFTPEKIAFLIILFFGGVVCAELFGQVGEGWMQRDETLKMMRISCAINRQLRLHPNYSLDDVFANSSSDAFIFVPEGITVRRWERKDRPASEPFDFVVEKLPTSGVGIRVFSDGHSSSWAIYPGRKE